MIDVSDGLSSEIHHLAKHSGVGFEITSEKIPLAPAARTLAQAVNIDPLTWAMNGGEDYELLATFAPTKGVPASGWTAIGTAVPATQGINLRTPDGTTAALEARGYRHFANPIANPIANHSTSS